LGGDAARLRDNSAARLLIRDRERRLKKNLARIDNPRTATVDRRFRHGPAGIHGFISQRLLGDIFDGLKASGA
jgi:hypothetical protein